MVILDDAYFFHEIVDQLNYQEKVTLEMSGFEVGWLVNINDGLVWYRNKIIVHEFNEALINRTLYKHKLKRSVRYLQDALDMIHNCHRHRDVKTIGELYGLQRLDLYGTKVNDISALTSCGGLQILDLRGTKVSDEQKQAFRDKGVKLYH